MRIRKLAPSGRVEGRWLCHLEDGTILRLGESEVVAFGLGTGKELSGAELSALTEAARAARFFAWTRTYRRTLRKVRVLNALPRSWRAPLIGLYNCLAWRIARKGL